MITGVESTFEEVTVDSLSIKSKNELGTRWSMIRQRCRRRAGINILGLATTLPLPIPAQLPLPRAMASIESP